MIRKKFVNRKKELRSLENFHEKEGFEFLILSGRRRVGKTRLLQEFLKNKNKIFLLCENRKWEYNLEKFNEKIAEHFDIPSPNFKSFKDCFNFISKKKRKKTIVSIDEFSYLIKNNEDILAEFQSIIDENLQNKDIMLILSGSAVSMMEREILGHKSPLYGRTTGQIMLQPLKFRHLLEWYKDSNIEEIIKIYGICDGIPKYLEFFEGKNLEKEIKENIFNPSAFLFREPKLLLEEELREPRTYFEILESISLGYTKITEIANHSYMEAKNVSSYLSILRDLGFVRKETSILTKKRRRGIYRMKDNFFNFWFRFISKNFGEIENWQIDPSWRKFKKEFDAYLSFIFEKVCREFLLGTNYAEVGRWWYKDKEIDILGLNEQENKILFGECKWSKNPVGLEVLQDLEKKSKYVRWGKEKRKEQYALFSKSGFKKDLKELRRKDLLLYDLDNLKKNFMSQ